MNRASSFDVFDTILTRQIGSPEAAFLLLGNQLQKRSLIACTAEAFARIRSTAEHRAFENAGGLDSCVNLDKIYEEVGFVLRLTVEERRQLLEIELSLEQFLLEPVPAALAILDQARKRGDRILFLSDMYIGTEFIQKILTHHGLMQMGDRLYVSCDYSQSKYSGKLYRRMLQQEGLAPKSVTHCGNSLRSDIKMAQRSQLKTKSFEQGNLNRYEEILETYVWETEGLSSALAGASRLARLSQPRRLSKRDAALQEISASVAAPFLVGFTLWILKRAKKLGLKRLYFLSRDGQILLAIAQRLIKKLDFDCELLYLYGSRQAWLLPSLTYLNEETLANIFPIDDTDVHLRSVRILLARFQLQPEDIAPSLLKLGLSSNDWARNLTVSESQALRDLFLTPGPVQDKILAQAAAARAMLKTHLRQCGALTGEPMGLVDVGTGATLFHALSEIFETEGMSPPHGFYLGLRQAVKDSRFGLPEVYLYDERHHLGLLRADGLVTMLETFCSGDHGSVVGYQKVGDRVEPILTEFKNQRVLDWGYGLVQQTICAVADRLLLDPILLNPEANLCAASLAVFNLFWTQPTCQESLALGTFPMEDGWGKESISICLATPYKWRDVLKRSSRRHWWHGGAIAQSSTPIQWMFKGRKLIRQRMR